VEILISKKELAAAEKLLLEGYSNEHWREKFGARMLTGIAYCSIFMKGE
jgi:hypothetical protein